MFTGIIEEIGIIESVRQAGDAIVMVIKADNVLEDVHLGDSIAVSGVCLTVTSFQKSYFTVDVMPETVYNTSLKNLKKGSKVNLERAMSAGGRFGGHFVAGHVDGVGEIVQKTSRHNAVYYDIKVPEEISRYIVLKGSVAVDGTSLTIFGNTNNTFTISLIPHTVQETILGFKDKGDLVNIECDMLVKYIDQLIHRQNGANEAAPVLTEAFFRDNGF
jgi:riboflavin synthase